MKKTILIDMDDTLFAFSAAINHDSDYHKPIIFEKHFFETLEPLPGAKWAIQELLRSGEYDVQICSQPLWNSVYSYSEKVASIGQHFPDLLPKITLTHDKGLMKADFLIDDNPQKWQQKFEANGGQFIHFNRDRDPVEEWERILNIFKYYV